MVFGIDDSEIEICGSPHTILAAVGIEEVAELERALSLVKAQFGLSPRDEVKWNGMKPVPQHAREALSQELLVLLHQSTPLVNITEGRNKDVAAQNLAVQIADCMTASGSRKHIEFVFDQSIISSISAFKGFLESLPFPVSLAPVTCAHSHESAVIQLADVFAGFNRLATDIAIGRRSKTITIFRDGSSEDNEIDLLSYICIALRWPLWGVVPPPPDPANPVFDETWPFKHIGGYGLRIHSGIDQAIIQHIYDSRIVYAGCLS